MTHNWQNQSQKPRDADLKYNAYVYPGNYTSIDVSFGWSGESDGER